MNYPKPDIRGNVKPFLGMAMFLAILQWIPEVAMFPREQRLAMLVKVDAMVALSEDSGDGATGPAVDREPREVRADHER